MSQTSTNYKVGVYDPSKQLLLLEDAIASLNHNISKATYQLKTEGIKTDPDLFDSWKSQRKALHQQRRRLLNKIGNPAISFTQCFYDLCSKELPNSLFGKLYQTALEQSKSFTSTPTTSTSTPTPTPSTDTSITTNAQF